MLAIFDNAVADLVDAGLDADDLRLVIAAVSAGADVPVEIREPRLLHGDLWTPNVMLAADAPEPTITGVLDHDRASWGDPAADWGLSLITGRPPEAQEAFWAAYGFTEPTPNAQWRATVYRAMHLAAARLERHRIGRFGRITASYDDMRVLLKDL